MRSTRPDAAGTERRRGGPLSVSKVMLSRLEDVETSIDDGRAENSIEFDVANHNSILLGAWVVLDYFTSLCIGG